jgi:hypothetical protein
MTEQEWLTSTARRSDPGEIVMATKDPLCQAHFTFDQRYHKAKKVFETRRQAARFCNDQRGGSPYLCPVCGKWHITTSLYQGCGPV